MKQKERQVRVRIRKGFVVTLLLLATVIAVILTGFYLYHENLEERLNTYTEENLKEISNESSERITLQVADYFRELEILATVMNGFEYLDGEETKAMLSEYQTHADGVLYDYFTPDKQGILKTGFLDAIEEEAFFAGAAEGQDQISKVFDFNGSAMIAFAYPVLQSDTVEGVLISCHPLSSFGTLTSGSVFAKKTSTFIIQSDGTVISRSKGEMTGETFFEILKRTEGQESAFRKLEQDIKNGEEGIATYGTGTRKRYISYTKVAGGEWYSVSIVSASVIEPYGQYIDSIGMNLSYTIIAAFSVFILYMFLGYIWNVRRWYNSYRRSMAEKAKQKKK